MKIKILSPKYGEKEIYIDSEDYALIKGYNWSISYVRGNWYAVANSGGKQIKMHRMILNEVNPDVKVDHINGNGLDNRRVNLRRATIAENTRNTGPNNRNSAGYKGVYQYTKGKNTGKFTASLKVDGKKVHGGYFYSAIEAAEKYNELAKEYHKEFGYINFINEVELMKAKAIVRPKKKRMYKEQDTLKTGFFGVVLAKDRVNKPFKVQIKANGTQIFIGTFKTAIDAARAYNNAAIKYFGESAHLNKIPNE